VAVVAARDQQLVFVITGLVGIAGGCLVIGRR